MPIWKSGMSPELTCPVRLAMMLNSASMLPSSPVRSPRHRIVSQIPTAPYVAHAPRVKPNSEIFGGTSVPAATAPRLIAACTLASTSSETEAVDEAGISELTGQSTLVLNRFVAPEKSRGCRFCDIVLLNVVAFCSAASGSPEENHVSRPLCGAGIEMLTLEHVAEEAASVDVARRAVQRASTNPVTLVHRSRRSQGKRAVASFDVQALDGKVHAPVPAVPSQHQLPSNEIGVPGTHRGGVAAAKSVSSAREWTCASFARGVTAGELGVLDWVVVQCLATRAKGIGPH